MNDQRSPLDQIKIELEPSQITGPQFRLGKPFSLTGGCPPIALKRIFLIFGEYMETSKLPLSLTPIIIGVILLYHIGWIMPHPLDPPYAAVNVG